MHHDCACPIAHVDRLAGYFWSAFTFAFFPSISFYLFHFSIYNSKDNNKELWHIFPIRFTFSLLGENGRCHVGDKNYQLLHTNLDIYLLFLLINKWAACSMDGTQSPTTRMTAQADGSTSGVPASTFRFPSNRLRKNDVWSNKSMPTSSNGRVHLGELLLISHHRQHKRKRLPSARKWLVIGHNKIII